MDAPSLGMLLHRIYPEFDMSKFEFRLKLQKVIFLMKCRGIDLGYRFNFYLYGPYSTDLSRTGFQIVDYNKLTEGKFDEKILEENFKKFLSELDDRKNDKSWLEITSSILFFKKIGIEEKNIISEILKYKGSRHSEKDIEKIMGNLKTIGWLND